MYFRPTNIHGLNGLAIQMAKPSYREGGWEDNKYLKCSLTYTN
jgi:hypothetical protein